MFLLATNSPVSRSSDEGQTGHGELLEHLADGDGVGAGDSELEVLVGHGVNGRERSGSSTDERGQVVEEDHPRLIAVGNGSIGGPDPGLGVLGDTSQVIDVQRGLLTSSRDGRVVVTLKASDRLDQETSPLLEGGEVGGSPILLEERNDGLDHRRRLRGHRNAVELANSLRGHVRGGTTERRGSSGGSGLRVLTNGKAVDSVDHHHVLRDGLRHRVVLQAAEVDSALRTLVGLHRNAKDGLDLGDLRTNDQNLISASLLNVSDSKTIQPVDNSGDRASFRLGELRNLRKSPVAAIFRARGSARLVNFFGELFHVLRLHDDEQSSQFIGRGLSNELVAQRDGGDDLTLQENAGRSQAEQGDLFQKNGSPNTSVERMVRALRGR